ncbi:hypothetical protein CDAR_278241 [Caerostris darwini]|uniref:Uncharacterized protein n=1 Tax=Caerostris darwini TaxID=1538125 RepID=A0AAV4WRX7_9ARAC|nr:hypothetical protein CDAR_278241 [Caerostris darwini]
MFAKIVILCLVVAAAHASLVGPLGWGGPVGLAAGPWGLAGKGWGAAPYGYYGNGAIAGNGILSSGWRGTWGGVAPLGVAKVGVAGPLGLGLGLGKVW